MVLSLCWEVQEIHGMGRGGNKAFFESLQRGEGTSTGGDSGADHQRPSGGRGGGQGRGGRGGGRGGGGGRSHARKEKNKAAGRRRDISEGPRTRTRRASAPHAR